ncbi:MAG: hypothetical protein KGK08_00890 [Acidobacteriota bacterium]|nr:hypothetical protein [Acidobacteriota bacterium]
MISAAQLIDWFLALFALGLNAWLLAFALTSLPFIPAVTDCSTSTGCESLSRADFTRAITVLLFVVSLVVFHRTIPAYVLSFWSAAPFLAALAYLSPGEVLVTQDGLLRAHPLRGNILLRWSALDHYEVSNGPLHTLYFRTRTGQTISVNSWTNSPSSLLERIRTVAAVPQQPYHHQHWYGG